jgi:hypothetical protein
MPHKHSFRSLKYVALVSLLLHKFACPPCCYYWLQGTETYGVAVTFKCQTFTYRDSRSAGSTDAAVDTQTVRQCNGHSAGFVERKICTVCTANTAMVLLCLSVCLSVYLSVCLSVCSIWTSAPCDLLLETPVWTLWWPWKAPRRLALNLQPAVTVSRTREILRCEPYLHADTDILQHSSRSRWIVQLFSRSHSYRMWNSKMAAV